MIFVLSTDVDFVSDAVLEAAYQPLQEIPMTVFMTGKSDYLLKAFRNNPFWEAEVHPNFCYGSTQGDTIEEIFKTLELFSGEKLGFRCHKYYCSNDIEEKFEQLGYLYASNICTDLEEIKPFMDRCGILQIPIFMEDGGYLKYHGVPRMNDILPKMQPEGIYVFNFHPIHLALNSNDFSTIRALKDSMTSSEYGTMTVTDISVYRNKGYGIADFLNELIVYAHKNNIQFILIC